MKIIHIDGAVATAEVDGVTRQARLDLLPEAALGDFILVHAGLAISRIDAEEAAITLDLLRQLADAIQ